MKPRNAIPVVLVLTAAVFGCSSEPAATVTMTNDLAFESDTVRVAAGETVAWRNSSDLVHTVTADPARATRKKNVSIPPGAESFDSGALAPGAVYSRAFELPGTYRYFCVPHEAAGMVGVVIVSE